MTDQTVLEARIKELEARLARLERPADRIGDQIESVIRTVVPDETRGHMRAAWREQLMALRSFLDHWIESDRLDGASPARERIEVR
ncbi:MAG TPA: hypothetical protein VL493_10015 [Candidatus Saccharimonadales bacterium]|nr:hypothetical protein [Candidatus Saccharimonadales bacterium]